MSYSRINTDERFTDPTGADQEHIAKFLTSEHYYEKWERVQWWWIRDMTQDRVRLGVHDSPFAHDPPAQRRLRLIPGMVVASFAGSCLPTGGKKEGQKKGKKKKERK